VTSLNSVVGAGVRLRLRNLQRGAAAVAAGVCVGWRRRQRAAAKSVGSSRGLVCGTLAFDRHHFSPRFPSATAL